MLASEIWARVLVCEFPYLQDSTTLWAPWRLQWIVFSLSFWFHSKQVAWVKYKSFLYVKPVSAWGCWLLQCNLPYTEACRSSTDLGLDVCNVLCSTLILLFLNPSWGENSLTVNTRGTWWQEAHRRKKQKGDSFKSTGIKSRYKLQNVRSPTVTSASSTHAFLKQNQGFLNGGQSFNNCLHCTSLTLLV